MPRDASSPSAGASFLALIALLALTALVAAMAAQFEPGHWYRALEKPPWTPPDAVFPPVWTALYAAMAVAAWLTWRERGPGPALVFWTVQLALNGLWSWLFFGLQRPGLALADLAVLFAVAGWTTALFWRANPVAGGLMVPYLVWLGYAASLNVAIVRLNP